MDSTITQWQFADMVGVSEAAVSGMVKRCVIIHGQSAGAWLKDYCAHLREMAAARAASGDLDLATERAGLAKAQREKIEMQNAITRSELAPRELLVQVLAGVAPKICEQLEAVVPALRRRGGYSAEDLAFVSETMAKARNDIAALKLPDVTPGADADPGI